ncbi:MAG: calcium/sodium antiporter [Pseudomonadota bacterium]
MLSILFIVGGLVGLFIGGELLVKSAVGFGQKSGLTPLVIGLTLVAFGTSAPELAVSVDAVLQDAGEIALSNVVGSNMANIALVLALAVALKPVAIGTVTLRRDIPVMLTAFALFSLLLFDGVLGRLDGVILVSCLVAYTVYVIKHPSAADSDELIDESGSWLKLIAEFSAGLALLVFGGHWLVAGAIDVAGALGVSQAVIGMSVVAIGTSLPEITASVIATLRGHSALALGNVVGSNIWNSFGILGAAASIKPIEQGQLDWIMVLAMALVGLILWVFCRTSRELQRWEGLALLAGYIGFQIWLFQ